MYKTCICYTLTLSESEKTTIFLYFHAYDSILPSYARHVIHNITFDCVGSKNDLVVKEAWHTKHTKHISRLQAQQQ